MRRWMAAPVVFAAAAALALVGDPRPARAQNKPVEENFTTADGVRLKGLFHKSGTPAEGNPVVVLLYPPGAGNSLNKPGDWDGLASTLNKAGYHVFRFDWRGHGKSTDIVDTDEFWNLTGRPTPTGIWNQKYVKGVKDRPVKNTLSVAKDIDPKYFPVYVNDLAAARFHLDAKNDDKRLNTGEVYLIGAGDAATLGLLWLAAEWHRPAVSRGGGPSVVPSGGGKGDMKLSAGVDVAGAVWLSATRPAQVKEKVVEGWVAQTPKLRDRNPMLFLQGAQEPAKAGADGKFFFEQVLKAKGSKTLNPLDQTFLTPISGTKLGGVELLGKSDELATEGTILSYLKARRKDRDAVVRQERKYVTPYAINLAFFGVFP